MRFYIDGILAPNTIKEYFILRAGRLSYVGPGGKYVVRGATIASCQKLEDKVPVHATL